MHLTARDLLIASAAFSAAFILTPHIPPRNTPSQTGPRLPIARSLLPKITNQQKIAAAAKQLKILTPPKGISSLVEISPRAPYVKDMAFLSCFNDITWSAGKDPDSTGSIYGIGPDHRLAPYNLGLYVTINYQVAQPNKVHVVTFFIDSNATQDMKVGSQTVQVQKGLQTIPMAIIPGRTGWTSMSISSLHSGFTFYKAEVDVLD